MTLLQSFGLGVTLGSLVPQEHSGSIWLVGRVGMPDGEVDRLTADMRRLLFQMKSTLEQFTTFDLRHPGRGSPLFKFLELDHTDKKTLPYGEARDYATRVAERASPKIKEFILKMMNEKDNEISVVVTSTANSHILSVADRPAISYVIKAKYEVLQRAFRQTLSSMAGWPISLDRIMLSVHKKPVSSQGQHAAIEGMQNLHIVDEYQVICSVTEQFADHATQIAAQLDINVSDLVARLEEIEIPYNGEL